MTDISLGRNGGHLAPHAFFSFNATAELHGLSEAKRSVAIEQYTESRIRDILADSGDTDHVDFVSGGRITLFFSHDEERVARADYEAAKIAGVDLSGVYWLTREEVQKVCAQAQSLCI